ncbi:MAG: 1-(5-phosphoribosyl)-5-[(5-phosphoribosylamino)methylideneamino]imidazole-4-carboxamide isomerase [Actinobacteria bacterium]|nr:1-(5-phosphoribosyl)-5-[(5-phosphoribosylamino)methylideneamino]imidazole-4-carboxamide isomerase [Actinomycetota bacterium]
MKLYPAIDLRGGRCVRLYQGDYDRETHYGDDPVSQALQFAEAGAPWIHVVDLDAARSGEATNREVIAAICAAVKVPVQSGGGVRSVDAAAALADAGVARVVIGTAALENPDLVEQVAARQKVAVGLDARGTDLATHGWEVSSGLDLVEVATRFANVGTSAFVVTEIAVDGTLEGPAIAQLSSVLAAMAPFGASAPEVIASGGVGTVAHLEQLAALTVDGARLGGAIMGRALYEKAFTLSEALDAVATIDGGAA